MNLFEKAINNNELNMFALGEADYFILDRENDEHWVLGSWLKHIIPYINENENENVEKMFMLLIKNISFKEKNKFDALLYHTYTYLYLLSEKRIDRSLLKMSALMSIIVCLDRYLEFAQINCISEYTLIKNSITLIKNKIALFQ
jgi:hypothetical protein